MTKRPLPKVNILEDFERNKAIAQAWNDGSTMPEVARRFNLSDLKLRLILREMREGNHYPFTRTPNEAKLANLDRKGRGSNPPPVQKVTPAWRKDKHYVLEPVRIVEIFGVRTIVVLCPFCNKEHRHAWPADQVPDGSFIRKASCNTMWRYEIKPT